jgi:hypothetical protein
MQNWLDDNIVSPDDGKDTWEDNNTFPPVVRSYRVPPMQVAEPKALNSPV